MKIERLVEERQPSWNRLSFLLDQLQKRGARRVPAGEIQEVLTLYRETAADLARLRGLKSSPVLIARVNRLTARAHGWIYRHGKRSSFSLHHFFLIQIPRLFRENWRFTFASFICSALFFALSFGVVSEHPEIAADILGGMDEEFSGEKTASDIVDRFRQTPSVILSSAVTTNNIKVALAAFAMGITFGLGTVYMLIVNGTMLGGIAGAFAQSGAGGVFWLTILPHGALELSAIVVAGGAGLMMGFALWCPGRRSRIQALREEAARAVQIALALIPAFLMAGYFEGFLTPSGLMPAPLKAGLGIGVALLFWAYLLLSGSGSESPVPLEREVPFDELGR